jgi:hypothetical protein
VEQKLLVLTPICLTIFLQANLIQEPELTSMRYVMQGYKIRCSVLPSFVLNIILLAVIKEFQFTTATRLESSSITSQDILIDI